MPQNPYPFGGIVTPQSLRSASFTQVGATWFVNGATGSDTKMGGVSRGTPFATIGKALAVAASGDIILVAPGIYAESVTVNQNNLTIVGLGTPLDASLAPTAGTVAINVLGQRVRLENLDVVGFNGQIGAQVTGDQFTAAGCKFETADNLGIGLKFAPTGVAGSTASLAIVRDCEFAWAATGIEFTLNTGACTQSMIDRCWFHNLSAAALGEGASGGTVRNLMVRDCVFDAAEDGTEPTAYVSLNATASNTNTGVITRCSFPVAINSGKNIVSTKIIWTSNFMTGGISGAQPS